MAPKIETSPVVRRVLVLEDEPRVMTRISSELAAFATHAVCATSKEQLFSLIREQEVDVVSIDWELHTVDCGPEVLDYVHAEQPEVSGIVWTKHQRALTDALHFGADECLLKTSDYGEYVTAVGRCIRLTYARRIVSLLEKLGEVDVPQFDRGRRMNDDIECELGRRAHRAAIERVLRGSAPDALLARLTQRGWWRLFDFTAYVRLARSEKLRLLVAYLQEETEDDALEALGQQVTELSGLTDGAVAIITPAADLLLSVLSYLLTLSDYRPELMMHYWTVRNMFARSVDGPPWDSVGLASFLVSTGREGLEEATKWIRSH